MTAEVEDCKKNKENDIISEERDSVYYSQENGQKSANTEIQDVERHNKSSENGRKPRAMASE